MSRFALVVASGLLCATLVQTAEPRVTRASVPQAPPVFRADVDIVTLDVVVLDKNRQPVKGLTAADFLVREAGDPQELISFKEIVVPPPDMAVAGWLREAPQDVVSNDVAGRRLVVMLLDDANGCSNCIEPGHGGNALALTKRTGHAIIDQLGPADLGAVVYTFLGRFENFTSDKSRLHAAVEDFTPRRTEQAGIPLGCVVRLPGLGRSSEGDGSGCQINSLTRIADVLRTAPPGRKMVAFVSPGLNISQDVVQNPDALTALPWLRAMFQSLQAANATVYTFDPRGLMTSGLITGEVALASATGGRAIRNTNAPDRVVPAVFQENSDYYLLGYRSSHTRANGLFRRVEVRVDRPGVQVISRNGYFGPGKVSTKASRQTTPSALDLALAGGVPATDLQLRVNVAPFAVAGVREAELAVTIAIADPIGIEAGAPRTHTSEFVSVAYDTGWRMIRQHRQTIALTRRPETDEPARYEVMSRLPLKPGRYELRFAAGSEGRTGSTYVSVDIPNFAKESLSLSGLVVQQPAGTRDPVGVSLSDLLPVVPTTARVFTPRDTPLVFMRVYQGGSKPLVSVPVTAHITDSGDRRVFSTTRVVMPADFTSRAADYRLTLPVTRLPAGEYLLTIQADPEGRCIERTVRFRVE